MIHGPHKCGSLANSSLSYVFTLFNLPEEKAAEAIVGLWLQGGTDRIASAAKLLFLGSRVFQSAEALAGLQPIKEMILSTYRDAEVGSSLLDSAQK